MPVRVGQEIQEVLRQGIVSVSGTRAPWYAGGLRFACTRCGNCCSGAPGYVWTSESEARAIARALDMSFVDFARRHLRRVGQRLSLLERSNGDCEFLVREESGVTSCAIHAVRPTQCRTWPFWKSNVTSARAWERTGRECPGVNTGPLCPQAAIDAALRANGDLPL